MGPAPVAGIAAIPPKSEVATRSASDDNEYRRNYGAFEYVHALYALDHGWTGQGALVGVVDDGVAANAELAGQLSPLGKDFGNVTSGGKTSARNVIGDAYSDHGTMVAGVIAAMNDGVGVQGIAPDAKIVALRVSDVNTDTKEETLGRTLPTALAYAGSNGIKVVNASLAKVDAGQPSTAWSDMVSRYVATGGLFVNSTGNDGEANAKGYLDLNAANRDGWLFVTAVEETQDGVAIADYANRCGAVAMARCVSAMGTNATMDANGQLVWFSGTSAAAAQVSGLAALILSKWPQLSGVQAGQVILNTARDLGEAGTDTVYGRGLIDVEAALAPVDPTVSNGVSQTTLSGAAMVIPDALGGAATTASVKQMLSHVTVLDAYGRDFSGSLAGLVAHPGQGKHAFARRVAAGAGAGSTAFAARDISVDLAYTTYARTDADALRQAHLTSGAFAAKLGSTKMLASYAGQDAIQDEAMGLAPASDIVTAYAPGANLAFGVEHKAGPGALLISALSSNGDYGRAKGVVVKWSSPAVQVKGGYLVETGTLFGTPVGAGALRFGDGARSLFLEVSRNWGLGRWSLDTYASMGATHLKIGSDSLLTSASTILTQRAGVSASTDALGGRVRLGVALPLMAFSGSADLTYARGYDLAARSLVYDRERVALTGRYDPVVSLGFEKSGPASSLRLAAATNTDAQDWRALASWRWNLR
jgi:hypothetical protein